MFLTLYQFKLGWYFWQFSLKMQKTWVLYLRCWVFFLEFWVFSLSFFPLSFLPKAKNQPWYRKVRCKHRIMNKHDILLKNPTDKTALSSCWSTSKNLCTLEKNTFSFYLTEAVVCEIFPLWRVPNTVQSDQREKARNQMKMKNLIPW